MPVHSKRTSKGYKVVDNKGKTYGTHKTKKAAVRQVVAVNIAAGHVRGLKPRKRKKR